jgi:hypothetical protein
MPITYSDTITPYAQGRRVNAEEWNGVSRVAEGAIGFGVPVMPGTARRSVLALSATTGQNVLGITEARPDLPHPGDAYAVDDTVAVCEVGVIGVLLGANVTAGAQARWNTANSTWTGAAQSATVVTIPGAQFDEAGTSGDVGVVRYRRPVPSLSVSG